MKRTTAFAPFSLALFALALGACATRETRDDPRRPAQQPAPRSQPAPATPPAPATAPTPAAAAEPAGRTSPPAGTTSAPVASDAGPQFTGIEVCDEYLARYKACHSTIGTNLDTLDDRLIALRSAWQQRARDPAQHEALRTQCQSLTATMNEALDGRDCELPENDFYRPEDDATPDRD